MSSLSVTVALYRYRWHIRLVLYEAFRGQGDRWRRLQEQHFQYDVFVSYDSEDELWVQQHLMPELEERLGLRLCLHERDFIPGKNIVDNIVHCVQNSKKVMMLFSTNFSQSPWCQFELNLCLSHVMENDDMLLVVLLEDIPSRDLTPAMMAVMKTTTYIEWDDHPEARASFWGRLQLGFSLAGVGGLHVQFFPVFTCAASFNNELESILHDTFFLNVTNISHLELEDNGLKTVGPGAFGRVNSLSFLALSANLLTYEMLGRTLESLDTLTLLIADKNNLGPVPGGFFETYPMLRLRKLSLIANA
nr:hypothetical protein BaRGS_024137 [Batillaria attramentaria]